MLPSGLLLIALAAPPPGQAEEPPEVWMCHGNPWPLAEPDAEWDYVKAHLDVLQLYIDKVNKCPPDRLKALVEVLEANAIAISIECGGTLGFAPLDDTNGERSAEIELAKMAKLTQAGGKLRYLNLDGSVRRLLYPGKDRQGFTSIERCVDELLDYMRTVREEYPDVEFFALTNFPNWGYKGDVSYHARGPDQQDWGDYFPVIQTIIRRTREAEMPIRGLTCDNPYEYAIGEHMSVKLDDPTTVDWMARVRDLEDYIEGEGLEFNLIVNSEQGGAESAEAFAERTLKFLDAYRAADGTPRRYIIQSWYKHPEAVLPETDPHTMTGLVKAVIERVNQE